MGSLGFWYNVRMRLCQAWYLMRGYTWVILAFFRGAQWEAQPYRPSGRERDRELLNELKETHS